MRRTRRVRRVRGSPRPRPTGPQRGRTGRPSPPRRGRARSTPRAVRRRWQRDGPRPAPRPTRRCPRLPSTEGSSVGVPAVKERAMELRRVGSLEVSVAGLGCNNFGMRIDEDASKLVVDAALEAGVNHFDTADIYGKGQSEVFLGRALGSRRAEAIITTKVGMQAPEGEHGGSESYITRHCEESLARLGTDRIELYLLHQADPETPIAETLGAFAKLVAAGKVREIGCSNFSGDQ